MKKRLLSFVLAVLMIATLLPVTALAADVVASGTCGAEGDGSNLTWTVDSDGTLTIAGKGEMHSYENTGIYGYGTPWRDARVTRVVIQEGVTTIGSYAFIENRDIASVQIPDTVETIGSGAFQGTHLKEVVIPDSVTSIGREAFRDCTSLKDITLSNGVQDLGYVFAGCTALESVTIPSGVISLGSTFKGCTSLKNITFPDGVTSIKGAFRNCTALTTVTLPDSVEDVSNAFGGCTALTTLALPDSVEDISSAFSGCTALADITLPRNLKTINGAFAGCTSLTDIAVAEENPYFCSMSGIVYSKDQKTIVAYPTGRPDTAFAIPEGTTGIGNGAFSGCSKLTAVTIPEGVTSIGDRAFYACTGLTEITIPEGVTSIGDCAFGGYRTFDYEHYTEHIVNMNLTSITLPNSLTSIGDGAFQFCTKLESIVIPDGMTAIESGTFNGCESLQSISIPDSVMAIGGSAFIGCKSLKSVAIPSGVTSIDTWTFCACESLASVTIPDSVTKIGQSAFSRCTALKSVSIPSGVTSIDTWTFSFCESLASVTIPDTVTEISGGAFDGCTALKDVYFLGTKDAWQKVSIGSENEPLTENAAIHYFSKWTQEKAPTCTEPGSETSTCPETDCGKTFTRKVPALGHAWDDGVVTKPATETETGLKAFTCTRCSATKTEIIPVLPHVHRYKDVVTEPTCTEKGYTTHTCACGDSYVDTYTTALGHAWDNGKVTKEPTETETGVKTFTCTRCDATKTETIPATGGVDVTQVFTDVEKGWAYPGIQYCVTNGLMIGSGDGKFDPQGMTTRAQFVQMLYSLHGKPEVSGKIPFTDLTQDWYKDAILWAYQNGLTSGIEKDKFGPEDPISREQTATILMKFATVIRGVERTWTPADLSKFPDSSSVSDWAKAAMQDMVALELITGAAVNGKVYLGPKNCTERQQIATILMQFCKNVKK